MDRTSAKEYATQIILIRTAESGMILVSYNSVLDVNSTIL